MLQIDQIWQDGGFQQPTDKIDPVDVFRTSWFGRQKWNHLAHTRLVVDRFVDTASACCFARFMEGVSPHLSLAGTYRVETCRAGGWALFPMAGQGFVYWLPSAPKARKVDTFGRILDEIDCPIGSIEMRPHGLTVVLGHVPGYCIDWLAWRFPADDKNIRSTLLDLPAIETQAIFLWGSHTTYQRLADVYDHLIYGHVYENRFAWPHRRKICSENDAHALYVALSGLEGTTGKQLYGLLKRQLLLSVLARQDKDGGWRHGEWTDGMESHYRLHCSAMHMLMDALGEQDDPVLTESLRKAAAFLSQQHDRLAAGVWFLHDGLEHSIEAMREGPFRILPSRALGKSESNMLVLNSHLDATVALDRYREVTGDTQHQLLVVKAMSATRAVLSLRPAEWLYKPLFWTIRLTFLPTANAEKLPVHLKVLKRLAWKYLIPTLPYIKARFPRLAMPGGYIERELSLRIFAHEYLPINLMDLLRIRRRFPDEDLDGVICSGLELVQHYRLFERWPEIKGKGYAVGFWAEALYHACLLYPNAKYRGWLAQAVMTLQALGLGLPPSLLGANSEAVSPQDQMPAPVLNNERIRVVNLGRNGALEVLMINASDKAEQFQFLRNTPAGLVWALGTGPEETNTPREIAAGAWLWGRSPDPSLAAA